jgi:hypothetical protein
MTQRQGIQLKWRLNRDQGVPVEAVPFTLRSFLKLMVESLKIFCAVGRRQLCCWIMRTTEQACVTLPDHIQSPSQARDAKTTQITNESVSTFCFLQRNGLRGESAGHYSCCLQFVAEVMFNFFVDV